MEKEMDNINLNIQSMGNFLHTGIGFVGGNVKHHFMSDLMHIHEDVAYRITIPGTYRIEYSEFYSNLAVTIVE
jgi:hypothetical protein